jgi:hypothetical protein
MKGFEFSIEDIYIFQQVSFCSFELLFLCANISRVAAALRLRGWWL